jgi:hypothetical protein
LTSVADPDPGFGALFIPGSGMEINPVLGSGIWDEHPRSFFRELRNRFEGSKYFNSLMRIRIRDPESF